MSRLRAWAASAGRGTSTSPSGRTRARETPRRRRGARRRAVDAHFEPPRAAHTSRRLTRIRASAVTEVPVIATFRDELSRRVSSRVIISLGSPNLRASCAVIFPASSGRLHGDGGGLRVGRVRRPHARCGGGGGTGFDGVADALRGPSCLPRLGRGCLRVRRRRRPHGLLIGREETCCCCFLRDVVSRWWMILRARGWERRVKARGGRCRARLVLERGRRGYRRHRDRRG